MASSRKCLNSPDSFCYVCGTYTLARNRMSISDFHKKVYQNYFHIQVGNQDKSWAPHIICKKCHRTMERWSKGESSFSFCSPMIWREPVDHCSDCYFCMVSTTGLNSRTKKNIEYPNIPSVTRPVPHSDENPIPKFNELFISSDPNSDDDDYFPADLRPNDHSQMDKSPLLFDQHNLNDLVRDLSLSKENSELLASRLWENNLLTSNTNITFFRTRERKLLSFFDEFNNGSKKFVYCNDVEALLVHMGL